MHRHVHTQARVFTIFALAFKSCFSNLSADRNNRWFWLSGAFTNCSSWLSWWSGTGRQLLGDTVWHISCQIYRSINCASGNPISAPLLMPLADLACRLAARYPLFRIICPIVTYEWSVTFSLLPYWFVLSSFHLLTIGFMWYCYIIWVSHVEDNQFHLLRL